jgi:tetratricopeptide (TPR) repeat protein
MLALVLASQLIVQLDDARAERLKTWLTAVERHVPGQVDSTLQQVRRMVRADMVQALHDARAVSRLMREPRTTTFYRTEPGAGRLPPLILYSDEYYAVLKELATTARRRWTANELLKRAAILHTDIALLAPPDPEPMPLRVDAELLRATLYTSDGQGLTFAASVDHWEVARRLLARVGPRDDRDILDPAKDHDVLQWYRSTLALMQRYEALIQPHYATALRLFPDDAEVLFFLGAYHETMAAPHVNDALRRSPNPAGSERDVGDREAELRRARDFFRQVLTLSPDHVEARLRLGRVLSQQGQHDAAARELRRVLAQTKEAVLVYFGALFLGRVLESQRNDAAAREQYERAAALFPRAQAPRLALSIIAGRSGARKAALSSRDDVLPDDFDDPWWTYHAQAGRNADAAFAATRRALAPSGEGR